MTELASNKAITDHVKQNGTAKGSLAARDDSAPEKADGKGDRQSSVGLDVAGDKGNADQKQNGGPKSQAAAKDDSASDKVENKNEGKASNTALDAASDKSNDKSNDKQGDKSNDKQGDKVSADQKQTSPSKVQIASKDDSQSSKADGKSAGNGLGNQAQEVVSQMANQAKELVTSRVAEHTGRSAGELGTAAKALRATSEMLDGNLASPLVEKAADQLDKASQFLQGASPNQILQSVETFARKEPLLFLGGAFVAGLAAGRFLKSSASRNDSHEEEDDTAGEPDSLVHAAAGNGGGQMQNHTNNHAHKKHGHGGKHRRR